MQTPLYEPRQSFGRRHPILADGFALVALFLVAVVLNSGLWFSAVGPLHVLIMLGMLLPYAFRRRWPVAAAIAVALTAVVQLFTLEQVPPGAHFIGVPMAVYWLAVYAPRWASRGGIALAVVGAIALGSSMLLWTRNYNEFMSMLVAATLLAGFCILICAVAWSLGDLKRQRLNHQQALAQYTSYLEAEARNARALAAADERQHIAREMHDIVAHSLSVIITQADGARYAAAADPQVAIDTLGTVAETGRDALADMRKLLGVLRAPGAAADRPQPQMSDIVELVEAMEVSGLQINAETSGTVRDVFNPVAQLAIYRVVQEGLTNALKHGDTSQPVTLGFHWQLRGLRIDIANHPRSGRPAGSLAASGAGQGLVGIDERIQMFGGTLTSGPQPDGRFLLTVFIPYPEK